MRLNFLPISALVLSEILLSGCGGKSRSQEVELSLLPQNPIVFTAPITYTNSAGTQVTIAAPWARFQINVNVPATVGDSVTIIHVNAQATGFDGTGNVVTASADFDPSAADYTATLSSSATVSCTYTDFGQFDIGGTPAGTTVGGNLTAVNDTLLFSLPNDQVNCAKVVPVFYFGGMPGATTGSVSNPNGTSSYNFAMLVTPQGWFGNRTTPTDRFFNTIYTSTQ